MKRGEELPQTKLTAYDVVLIRQLRAHGVKYRDIGKKFDVHYTTVWRICHYADWKHVKG